MIRRCDQSRTQSNACARARMALALGKLTTGTLNLGVPVLCRYVRLINVKPIIAQEKFNFPRANAILARAQALLWVRDCDAMLLDKLCLLSSRFIVFHGAQVCVNMNNMIKQRLSNSFQTK